LLILLDAKYFSGITPSLQLYFRRRPFDSGVGSTAGAPLWIAATCDAILIRVIVS
jgi:hypothetical protein